MKAFRSFLVFLVVVGAALPVAGAPCRIEFISHGTFVDDSGCLKFVDDLGNVHEVVNPRGAWRDGMTGTVISQFENQGVCSEDKPIRVCTFDADFTRTISGTLIFRTLIECPGFIITTGTGDYLIRNCEDFGDDLCHADNLDRRVKAKVFVDTGVSICLGLFRSTVLEFDFLN